VKKFPALALFLFALTLKLSAQTSVFGEVDTADLKMPLCSFDKGANAMILFSLGSIDYVGYDGLDMMVHKRIKIFNEKGLPQANVRLVYAKGEQITDVQAVTVNLVNNKAGVTALDRKLVYTQNIDKQHKAIIFTMPDVKAGSVIDIKYTWHTGHDVNYPSWLFQDLMPARFSQLVANMRNVSAFNIIKRTTQRFSIDTVFSSTSIGFKHIWALTNIPGFRVEPYMSSIEDNFQGIYFKPRNFNANWVQVGIQMYFEPEFGGQLAIPIDGENDIVAKAKSLKTNNEKIAYIFNTVKSTMKWNHVNHWYTEDGIKKAWENKIGNATEINLILYRLLHLAGIRCSLLVLNTREYGEIEINNPGVSRLNKAVVKVPVDAFNFYVMDASGKFNTYNVTPSDLLNLNMLTIDPDGKVPQIIRVNTEGYSQNRVSVTGAIKAGGTVEGNVDITSSNYERTNTLVNHDKLGDKKYTDEVLTGGNNMLKVSNLEFKNMENDTLPLQVAFNFKQELTESDDKYIYFNPNLFSGLGPNPFVNELRLSDIDFIFSKVYSINSSYKLPAGFKIDAMPKAVTLIMPDNSITFKRSLGEVDGMLMVRYVINFNTTRYPRDQYPELREFYKKMYELLNEQVVLKKS
jgi:hypothetical protein